MWRSASDRRVPLFMYGTAWKEDDTRRLVSLALKSGFRAIDTANQRKHYNEAAVGDAIAEAYALGLVRREDLFLQTKFTHSDGQDHRLPYDPTTPLAAQVKASFASSLEHLHATVVDAYVLHGPTIRRGLAPEDLDAWRAMEDIHGSGGARSLGVSNVSREQLDMILRKAKVRPVFVQNRCYASTGWDREIRTVCRAQGVIYQAFSLLTANRNEVASPQVASIAARHGWTPAQVIFRFALDVGLLPLTGTSSAEHMREDLAILDHPLDPSEVATIERLAG